MHDKPLESVRKRARQAGSVFTVLLAGIAMASALSLVLYQTISGPMSSMVRVTNKTAAKAQLQSVSNIVIMDAVNLANGGDCDADGSVEPRAWRVGTYGPTGGGLIPQTIGAPITDPWGTDYGYCVWDVGTQIKIAGCDGGNGPNAQRRSGSPTPTAGNAVSQTVLAIISAGPNRQFNTTCIDYVNGTTDLITTSSDDIVQRYTYKEAASATSALWTLKVADSTKAVIGKDIAIGSSVAIASATPTFSVNATTGAIQAISLTTSVLGQGVGAGVAGPGDVDIAGILSVGNVSGAYPLTVNKNGAVVSGNWTNVANFADAGATKGVNLGYDSSAVMGIIASHAASSGLEFWTHSGAWAERMRIDPGGNVGIGTPAPNAKLAVYGNGSLPIGWGDTSTIGRLTFSGTTAFVTTSSTSNDLALGTNGGNAFLTISGANGNVGVNDVAPASQLSVKRTIADGSTILNINGGATSSGYRLTAQNNGTNVFRIGPTGYTIIDENSASAGLTVNQLGAGYGAIFNGGNVGIGTVAPASKLHVAGSKVDFEVLSTGSLSMLGNDETAGNATDLIMRIGANNNNGSQLIFQKGASNAGGAATTGKQLGNIIFQGGTGAAFASAAAIQAFANGTFTTTSLPTYLTFSTTPSTSAAVTERMRIDQNGAVGIGTTSLNAAGWGAGSQVLSVRGPTANGVVSIETAQAQADGAKAGTLDFVQPDMTAGNRSVARIEGFTSGATANNRGGYLAFSTRSDAVASDPIERMRITNVGHALPGADNIQDLGSVALRWRNVYAASMTLPTFTQGSVLFAGASGVMAQDNTKFYWDDTNFRLGIGATTPASTLDLGSGTGGRSIIWGGTSGSGWYDTIGTAYSSGSLMLMTGLKLDTTADQTLYSYTGNVAAAGTRYNLGTGDISFFNTAVGAQTAGAVFDYATNTKMTIKASGNVGIGTVGPASKLDVQGITAGQNALNVTFNNATNPAQATAYFVTSQPSNMPVLRLDTSTGGNSTDTHGLLVVNGGNGAGLRVNDDGTTTDSTPFIVDPAGSVGIGTATPGAYILNTQAATAQVMVQSTTGTNYAFSQYANGGGNTLVGTERSLTGGMFVGTTAYASLFGSTNGPVQFATNNNVRMTIDATGNVLPATHNTYDLGSNAVRWRDIYAQGTIYAANGLNLPSFTQGSVIFSGAGGGVVQDNANFFWDDTNNRLGIGTAVPSYPLHISKNQNANTDAVVENPNVGTAATAIFRVIPDASAGQLALISYSSGYTGANFAAGVNNAKLKLILDNSIAANSNGLMLATGGAVPLYFATASAERMRIDGAGNVGIGTVAPNAPLHVQKNTGNIAALFNSGGAPDANSGLRINAPISTTHYNWEIGAQDHVGGGFEITPSTAAGGTSFTTPAVTVMYTGNVGIGTTAPTVNLDVYNAVGWGGFDLDGLSGGEIRLQKAGTTYGQIYASDSASTAMVINAASAGNDMYFQSNGATKMTMLDSGNVGIGTVGPLSMLHISGTSASLNPDIRITNTAVGGREWRIGQATGGAVGNLGIYDQTAGLNRMSIDSSGNVGIGITGPGTTLDVTGSNATATIRAVNSGTGTGVLSTAAATQKAISGTGGYGVYGLTTSNSGYGGYFDATGSGGGYALVAMGGNVGIGTIAPAEKLHVYGSNPYVTTDASAGNPGFKWLSAGVEKWRMDDMTAGSDRMRIYNPGTGEVVSILQSGSVGIGTTAPSDKLEVASTAATSAIRISSNTGQIRRIVFFDNAGVPTKNSYEIAQQEVDNALFIGPSTAVAGTTFDTTKGITLLASGNVGIGTTGPTAKLDIIGPATGTGMTIRAGGGGDVVLASGGSLFFDDNYNYATGNFIRPTAANTQAFFTAGAERMRIASSGNVGIGSTNPTTFKLQVLGNVGPETDNQYDLGDATHRWRNVYVANNLALPTFSPGSVLFAGTSGVVSQDNANFFWDNTNKRLGIGTAAPAAITGIHMFGREELRIETVQALAAARLRMINNAGGNWYVGAGATDGSSNFQINHNSVATVGLNITTAGNVGIGTIAPGGQLEIKSNTTLGTSLVVKERDTANNAVEIGTWGITGYSGAMALRSNGVLKVSINAAGDTYFNNSGTGNFGIGTTNPATFKLQVAGHIGPETNNTYDLGSAAVQWRNVYATGMTLPTFTQGSVLFAGASGAVSQDNANFFWDNASKRLGIGAAPSYPLHVVGNIYSTTGVIASTLWSSDSIRKVSAAAPLYFRNSAGTAEMTLDGSGNLGIGTTPGAKLDVYGGGGAYIGDASSKLWIGPSAGTNYIESGNTAWNANANLTLCGFNCSNAGTINLGFATTALTGNMTMSPANPSITSGGSYITIPNGLYVSGGTPYFQTQIQARGGVHDDSNATLTIAGGTAATTTFSGSVYAPIMYDSNNAAYYVDPASTSITNDMRANIFYDQGNTAYYVDPASTSNLNLVYTADSYTSGWFRNSVAGQGLYNSANTNHWYSNGNLWETSSGGSAVNGGIKMASGYSGGGKGYLYWDASGGGLLNDSGNWAVKYNFGAANSGGTLLGSWTANIDMRSPIFYDQDNTAYYVDPASTSNMNTISAIRVYGTTDIRSPIFYDNDNTAYYVDPASTSQLNILNTAGAITASGEVTSGGWLRSTGNTGWYSNTWGGGWYMTDATWIRSYNAKAVYMAAGYDSSAPSGVNCGGGLGGGYTFQVCGSALIDIMYDRNNTAYYVDPASTTIMNDMRANIYYDYGNTAYYIDPASTSITNDFRANIFYDQGNTAYYTDPASTSNMNVVNVVTANVSGVASAASFVYTSDMRLKKDIKTLDGSLDKILKMRGVQFNWKKDGSPDIGVIAQEVQKVYPDLVQKNPSTGFLAVKYGNMIGPLIEAVKELEQKIEKWWSEISKIWAEIKTLKEKIQAQDARITAQATAIEELRHEIKELKGKK